MDAVIIYQSRLDPGHFVLVTVGVFRAYFFLRESFEETLEAARDISMDSESWGYTRGSRGALGSDLVGIYADNMYHEVSEYAPF